MHFFRQERQICFKPQLTISAHYCQTDLSGSDYRERTVRSVLNPSVLFNHYGSHLASCSIQFMHLNFTYDLFCTVPASFLLSLCSCLGASLRLFSDAWRLTVMMAINASLHILVFYVPCYFYVRARKHTVNARHTRRHRKNP